MLQRPEPVAVIELLAEDRAALLELLGSLTEEAWRQPTICAGWSVWEVALHLLDGDLRNLSRRRDGVGPAPAPGESLLDFINRLNNEWMRVGQRLSSRVLCELLAAMGPPLFGYLASLDPLALGGPVSWAGGEPAPVWLDVAREYTERWHHQQHIRDAVGKPGQTERRFLYPVLATFVHALPVAFEGVAASPGTAVQLHITGDAGGDWTILREQECWQLYTGAPDAPQARVTLDQGLAWRLFTKGLTPEAALPGTTLEGDQSLALQVLQTIAIIA
jgi:uncharacterized protein (TIGR03083 family)